MHKSLLLFCFILFVLFSCKKTTQTITAEVKKNDKNKIVSHKTYTKANTDALNKIKQWKEYALFNEFIKRFETISPTEAFDNIPELEDLTYALEDSLNINLFKNPSFKSRLHVLKNEVLRLNDMSNIPAITSNEVNQQIDKIFLVYGSLNKKINTSISQDAFEKEINLDNFFKMDKKELMEKENTKKGAK